MAKRLFSILTQDMDTCFLTGTQYWVERHHIFFRTSTDKKLCEEYGLILPVTHHIHNEPPYGIHYNKKLRRATQQYAQRKFEETYPELDFMAVFGENFLFSEDDGYEIDLRELGIYVPYLDDAC